MSSPPQSVHCRLAWVAGFCIGPFGGNERTWKPFNPILGETFELDLPSNGVRFLAEQVQPNATEAFYYLQSARCVPRDLIASCGGTADLRAVCVRAGQPSPSDQRGTRGE